MRQQRQRRYAHHQKRYHKHKPEQQQPGKLDIHRAGAQKNQSPPRGPAHAPFPPHPRKPEDRSNKKEKQRVGVIRDKRGLNGGYRNNHENGGKKTPPPTASSRPPTPLPQ